MFMLDTAVFRKEIDDVWFVWFVFTLLFKAIWAKIVWLIELTDEFNEATPAVLPFIKSSCDANVLLVDVTKLARLALLVLINPSWEVKVELIFDTDVFNVDRLVVWLLSVFCMDVKLPL